TKATSSGRSPFAQEPASKESLPPGTWPTTIIARQSPRLAPAAWRRSMPNAGWPAKGLTEYTRCHGGVMETISVAQARKAESIGRQVRLQGWIRTRRDSKGGFSFLELNDGSCQANIQIVADGKLANYESEIKHLVAGCSVTVEGEVKASQGKGQSTEVAAARVIVHGGADAETYPLQKKGHSFEFLRTIAHLRPRTNTFGAIARVRNRVSWAIHQFFQERGFLYLHTPIVTASDCE